MMGVVGMDMASPSAQITPSRILATLQAYRDAAALNTAIELDLFTRIAHGTDTAGKIAAELDVPVRGIRLLCEYLANSGLLEKEDEQLKLSEDAAMYLDKKSPAYLASSLGTLYSAPLLRAYEGLTEAIRKGGAGLQITTPPDWFDIARGVVNPAAAARDFASSLDVPTGQPLKILDVGAGDGAKGIAVAVRYPNAIVVALDCPNALREAQANANAAGLGTRFQNIPGDPLVTSLGSEYDVVLVDGNLLQSDESQVTSLFVRIHYALKKTGQLVMLKFLSEDNAAFLREFAGFRLNVLAATSWRDAHPLAEVKGMLESSGFRAVEAQPLPGARATVVTARP